MQKEIGEQMNKIMILGRLTKDPEIRKTTSNKSVANFTVAVNHKFNKEETDFFNCIAWEQKADFVAEKVGKGLRVLVVGKMESRSYDKSDGTKVLLWELQVEEVELIDWKEKTESRQEYEKPKESVLSKYVDDSSVEKLDISNDDLPF